MGSGGAGCGASSAETDLYPVHMEGQGGERKNDATQGQGERGDATQGQGERVDATQGQGGERGCYTEGEGGVRTWVYLGELALLVNECDDVQWLR